MFLPIITDTGIQFCHDRFLPVTGKYLKILITFGGKINKYITRTQQNPPIHDVHTL